LKYINTFNLADEQCLAELLFIVKNEPRGNDANRQALIDLCDSDPAEFVWEMFAKGARSSLVRAGR
jgi:hypothetical protein